MRIGIAFTILAGTFLSVSGSYHVLQLKYLPALSTQDKALEDHSATTARRRHSFRAFQQRFVPPIRASIWAPDTEGVLPPSSSPSSSFSTSSLPRNTVHDPTATGRKLHESDDPRESEGYRQQGGSVSKDRTREAEAQFAGESAAWRAMMREEGADGGDGGEAMSEPAGRNDRDGARPRSLRSGSAY